MPTWKTIFLKSVGFGTGFALVLGLIAVLWNWHSNRPQPQKPWNTVAIKALSTGSQVTTQADGLVFDFRYSLENSTDRDYTLPGDSKLLSRLPKDMSYREVPELTWEKNLFIPTGQKVNISIILPIKYSDFNFSAEKAKNENELKPFINRRFAEIDGFALFDGINRYRIDFPNGWPYATKRAEEQERANSKTTSK